MKKTGSRSWLPALIFLCLAAAALAYTLTGSKWPVGTNVGYFINANTAQVTNEASAVKSAASSWSQINPSGLKMTYLGATSATNYGYTGTNTVCWRNTGDPSVLATAYWWRSGGVTLEADLVFNDFHNWSTTGANYDIETVSLHEFGHWIGLGHSATGIMRAYYGGSQRTIDSDARAGFEAMYGSGPSLPAIQLDRTSLSFTGSQTKSFKIRNSGEGTLNYQVDPNRSWMSVNPDSGSSGGEWDEILVSINTLALNPGSYTGTVSVTSGNASNSSRNLDVNLTVINDRPPSVTITSPAGGIVVTRSVMIKATATDDYGVQKVEFYVDNALKKTNQNPPYSWEFHPAAYSSGFHSIKARAYDTINQTAEDTIQLKVDKPPTVTLTSPSSSMSVSGTVAVTATASDDFGVKNVQFSINNVVKKTDNSLPYTFSWNTSVIVNGEYGIKAVVTDSIGQTAQQAVTVYVLPHPPASFNGELKNNSSTLLEQYFHVLTWANNTLNSNISKYRLYLISGQDQTLLAEVDSGVFEFLHKNVEKDRSYLYQIKAFDIYGREGLGASVEVGKR